MRQARELWRDEGSLVHAVWRYPKDWFDPPPGSAAWVLCHDYRPLPETDEKNAYTGSTRDVMCLWCTKQIHAYPEASS